MARVITPKPDNLLSIFFVLGGAILVIFCFLLFLQLLPWLLVIGLCLTVIAVTALVVYLLTKAGVIV